MKKLVLTMLTVLSSGAAIALPVGNPSDASSLTNGIFFENCGGCNTSCNPCGSWIDSFSFRFGFYGDYVFNRHLRRRNSAGGTGRGPVIERSTINTNAGYLALNFMNRFDVFTTLGVTRFHLDTNSSAFSTADGLRFHLDSHSNFSWSVGARLTIWECGCTALGIEGQYFAVNPEIDNLVVADTFTLSPGNFDINYNEWQVGLGLSHRIGLLVPYVAVKYSRVHTRFTGTTFDIAALGETFIFPQRLRSDKRWGYAVGTTLVDFYKMNVTAEARFADEKALYVNAQIRF